MGKSYTRNIKKQVTYWHLDDLGGLQQSVVRRPKNAMRTITETVYAMGIDDQSHHMVMEHHIERDGRIVRRFKTTSQEEREYAVPALIQQLFDEMPVAPAVYYWRLPTPAAKLAVRLEPGTMLPPGVTDYLTERVHGITPGVTERTIGCRGYTDVFQTPTEVDQRQLAAKYAEIIKTQAKKARTLVPEPSVPAETIQQLHTENRTRDLLAQRRMKEEVERQNAIADARRMVAELKRKQAQQDGEVQPRRTRRTTPIMNRAITKVGTAKVLKNIKKITL